MKLLNIHPLFTSTSFVLKAESNEKEQQAYQDINKSN